MTNEEKLEDVRKTAFITSHYICKNYHDAQDIAQDVCLHFLLKKDDPKNPIRNPISWSKVVARNKTYEKLKKSKNLKEINKLDSIANHVEDKAQDGTSNIVPDLPDLEKEDVRKLLNEDDFATYAIYLENKGKSSLFAAANKLTYSSATTKIYRMKRNLKASYLQKAGYIGGKDIVDYQTNRNIIKFLKTFADKMQKNELSSLQKYFQHFSIDNIPKIDIAKYMAYEIKMIDFRKYDIYYGYLTSKGKIDFVILTFVLSEKNKIKIADIVFPRIVTEFKATLQEVRNVLPKSKQGVVQISNNEAIDIVSKMEDKE